MVSAVKTTYKIQCLLRQVEKKKSKLKKIGTAQSKNIKVEQEESRDDNKIDKWRSNECGNKEENDRYVKQNTKIFTWRQ